MERLKEDIGGFDYDLLSETNGYRIYGGKFQNSHMPVYIRYGSESVHINKDEFNVKNYELIKEHLKKLAS